MAATSIRGVSDLKLSIALLVLVIVALTLASEHHVARSQTPAPTPTPTSTPSPTPTPTPTVTATPTPTPSPTPAPSGSISGRVYVDVNANGTYDGPDAPWSSGFLSVTVTPPAHSRISSYQDGQYTIEGLPAGTYKVGLNFAIPPNCVGLPPFNWVGADQDQAACRRLPQLSVWSRTVKLAAGQELSGIDFPEIPRTTIGGRVWVDGRAASAGASLAVTVGDTPCWQGTITQNVTPAGITVAAFTADLQPISSPKCQHGDLALRIDGRVIDVGVPWNDFWVRQLWPDRPRSLGDRIDFMTPPFMGLAGWVLQPDSTSTAFDGAQLVEDESVVRAIIGNTVCGEAETRTLESDAGLFLWKSMNLFGLIVSPAELQAGCGEEGAPVTLCVDGLEAQDAEASSDAQEPITWTAGEIIRGDVLLEPTDRPCPVALEFPPTGSGPPDARGSRSFVPMIALGGILAAAGAALLASAAGEAPRRRLG